jgi:hypothetical protein
MRDMGRATLAVVAAALALAAPASAAMWPPPPTTYQPLHVLRIEARAHPAATRACMAREQRAKVARWLAPVACEQPPRSQLLIAAALFGD